jgi:hypothetical protein
VTSAHSRQAGSSKDRQPGLPGIGGEPGGPVYRESVVKRLKGKKMFFNENDPLNHFIHSKFCLLLPPKTLEKVAFYEFSKDLRKN